MSHATDSSITISGLCSTPAEETRESVKSSDSASAKWPGNKALGPPKKLEPVGPLYISLTPSAQLMVVGVVTHALAGTEVASAEVDPQSGQARPEEHERRGLRHARYFTRQLAESCLTRPLFRQIVARIEQLAWHPT